MKEIKFYVNISRSAEEVFKFTTNPANTPEWIESIVKEEAYPNEVSVGSIYKNWDAQDNVNEYVVTIFQPNVCFQLDATHQDYRVKYTYREINPSETELEYHEWSESGELHTPFMQEILDNLKVVMERETIAE